MEEMTNEDVQVLEQPQQQQQPQEQQQQKPQQPPRDTPSTTTTTDTNTNENENPPLNVQLGQRHGTDPNPNPNNRQQQQQLLSAVKKKKRQRSMNVSSTVGVDAGVGAGVSGSGSSSSSSSPPHNSNPNNMKRSKVIPAKRKKATTLVVPSPTNSPQQLQPQRKPQRTPRMTIRDDNPSRLVNPLLDLPEFPNTTMMSSSNNNHYGGMSFSSSNPSSFHHSKTATTTTSIDRIPNGAELYAWTDLYFCQPDTFPLSYYARLLGFDIPKAASPTEPFVSINPQTVPFVTATTATGNEDVWNHVPPLGKFASQIWKTTTNSKRHGRPQQRRSSCTTTPAKSGLTRIVTTDSSTPNDDATTIITPPLDVTTTTTTTTTKRKRKSTTDTHYNHNSTTTTITSSRIPPPPEEEEEVNDTSWSSHHLLDYMDPMFKSILHQSSLSTIQQELLPSTTYPPRFVVPYHHDIVQMATETLGNNNMIQYTMARTVEDLQLHTTSTTPSSSFWKTYFQQYGLTQKKILMDAIRAPCEFILLATITPPTSKEKPPLGSRPKDDTATNTTTAAAISPLSPEQQPSSSPPSKQQPQPQTTIVGFIHYKFQWYRFEEEDFHMSQNGSTAQAGAATASTIGAYGVSSGVSQLRKPKVSELVFTIEHVYCPYDDEGKRMETQQHDVNNDSQHSTIHTKNDKDDKKKKEKSSLPSMTTTPPSIRPPSSSTKDTTPLSSQSFLPHIIHNNNDNNSNNNLTTTTTKTTTTTTTIALLLVTLALEHAKSCDIVYGLLHTTSHTLSWFQTYFRMSILPSRSNNHKDVIPKDDPPPPLNPNSSSITTTAFHNLQASSSSSTKNHQDKEDHTTNSRIPLVCDLKKINYRYTFFKYKQDQMEYKMKRCEEEENKNDKDTSTITDQPPPPPQGATRMLVRLPTAEEAQAAMKEAVGTSTPSPTSSNTKNTNASSSSSGSGLDASGTGGATIHGDGLGSSTTTLTPQSQNPNNHNSTIPTTKRWKPPQPQPSKQNTTTTTNGSGGSSFTRNGNSHPKNNNNNGGPRIVYGSAPEKLRSYSMGVRAVLPTPESPPLKLYPLQSNGSPLNGLISTRAFSSSPPNWHILKTFPIESFATTPPPTANSTAAMSSSSAVVVGTKPNVDHTTSTTTSNSTTTSAQLPSDTNNTNATTTTVTQSSSSSSDRMNNELLDELLKKQKMLQSLETSFHPKLRELLSKTITERQAYESPPMVQERASQRKLLADYETVLERRREMDKAWQKQLEQDMDAVCDICQDGEVTPDNQILFCEACNVAVHQYCYGIEEVPEGDYYCLACRYFGREKMTEAMARKAQRGGGTTSGGGPAAAAAAETPRMTPKPLPICCELCPRKQGAFIRTDTPVVPTTTTKSKPYTKKLFSKSKTKDNNNNNNNNNGKNVSHWVHVICAKWQGLGFIPGSKQVIENVTELKENFRRVLPKVSCMLCLGNRGAFNQCPEPGCNKWLHVTCARAAGTCKVVHGENCHGPVETDGWTLWCPEHSNIPEDEIPEGSTPIDQLIRAAEEFPPEPEIPPPKPRPPKFIKMTGKERRQWLGDPEYEAEFLENLRREKFYGVKCEVCYQLGDDSGMMTRCVGCDVVFCDACKYEGDGIVKGKDYLCKACQYVQEKEEETNNHDFTLPQCHMCFQPGGWMRKSFANPVNKKSIKHMKELTNTYFSKDLWSHALCTLWQFPTISVDHATGMVDCSNVIMSNGRGHIKSKPKCGLCGLNGGLKIQCDEPGCRAFGEIRTPFHFHPTCARQAGIEIDTMPDEESGYYRFYGKCFVHSGCAFAFRAKLEDLLEIAKKRYGKRLQHLEKLTMSIADASRLLNASILVMASLGWAWRWAEWWVEFGDNWEPFLEPHEDESKMTKEQLRVVDSTKESRAEDARNSRLAALGAALRNRNYDDEEGDAYDTLDKALRAILHAKSLVGPLEDFEIDFFAEWLGRAYRSRSRLLGYTDDKILVSEKGYCVHKEDASPKYELGKRPLPGKQALSKGEVFEKGITDIDDFLKPETTENGEIITAELIESTKPKRKTAKKPGRPQGKKHDKRKSKEEKVSQEVDENVVEVKIIPENDVVVIPRKRSMGRGKRPGRKHHIMGEDDDDDDDYIDAAEMKNRKRGPGRLKNSDGDSASPRKGPGRPKKSDKAISSFPSSKRRGRPPALQKKGTKDSEKPSKRKHSLQRFKPRKARLAEEGGYQDLVDTSETSTDIQSTGDSASEYIPVPRKRGRQSRQFITYEMGSAVNTIAAANTRSLENTADSPPKKKGKQKGWPKGRPRKPKIPESKSSFDHSTESEEKIGFQPDSNEDAEGSSEANGESSSTQTSKAHDKEGTAYSKARKPTYSEDDGAPLPPMKI